MPKKLTQAEFLAKAVAVHGVGRYDYSQAVYTSNKHKVQIICPKHGVYEQTAKNHMKGDGCNTCGYKRGGAVNAANKAAAFIGRAQAIHGMDTYDYSTTNYMRNGQPVKIICPRHGPFEQVPNTHLAGRGCTECGRVRQREAAKIDWVTQAQGRDCILYLIRLFNEVESFYKVGVTFHSIAFRYRSQKILGKYKYEILAAHKSRDAAAIYNWEQSILETFAHLRYYPKRRFTGGTECFSSAEEILNIFPL